jgi:hypothetical protein
MRLLAVSLMAMHLMITMFIVTLMAIRLIAMGIKILESPGHGADGLGTPVHELGRHKL